MTFKSLVDVVMKYSIDRDTAENIVQDILQFHCCGSCAYYGDCDKDYTECEYAENEIHSSDINRLY